MINLLLNIISLISFVYCFVSILVGNNKFTHELKNIPEQSKTKIQSVVSYNNFKVNSYIMNDSDSDTLEERKLKKALRPILLQIKTSFVIFVVSIFLSFILPT